ncbi:Na+/H+ antiporter [Clostridium neuense]
MNLLMIILLLMVCLLISNIISHYIPFIPTALIQIALGVILAITFKQNSFEIKEQWFFLLFVAPILYNDGKYFPRNELWKMKWSIFGNSLVLVILTTIGGGYFIHWMIPDIPLAAAFALAAILSPTDPVAVNGIEKRIHIPEKILNLVRGESLINDASGIVAFNYAITAVVTSNFSLGKAILNFAYVFLVGAAVGLIFTLLITVIRFTLRKEGINDVIFHSLLQILTPFGIFAITEEFLHASGVIAVVAAGIVHSLIKERIEIRIAEEQVLTENIWSIILFVLNGSVFLLLGLNIPLSMVETIANPDIGNWRAVGYAASICGAVLTIRFAWAYFSSYCEYHFGKAKNIEKPNIKVALLTSLTGVRGTVTMAGVLSIPFFLNSGRAFPQRSLILFLTAAVILFTLVAATVFLPFLSKDGLVEGEKTYNNDLNVAKNKLLLASIKSIEAEVDENNEAAAYELINEYRRIFQKHRFKQDSFVQGADVEQRKVIEVRLLALEAERRYVYELIDKNEINEELFMNFDKAFDYREEAFLRNTRQDTMYLIRKLIRWWKRLYRNYHKRKCTTLNNLQLVKDIQLRAARTAVKTLKECEKKHGRSKALNTVIFDYKSMINRLKGTMVKYNEKSIEQKEELRIKAMDVERSEIRRMYELGEITREQSNELRRYINYIESVILYKPNE